MSRTYVLLHGSPGRGSLWEPLTALAPRGTRSIALDLLGHGGAPDLAGASGDDLVADVVARLREVPGELVLVGHSFGAWVAGRALPSLPGRVARLVAIAGIAGLDAEIAGRSIGFASALENGELTLEGAIGIACDLWLPSVERRPEDLERIASFLRAEGAPRLSQALRLHADLAHPDRWVAPHEVPTLSIREAGDRGVPLALAKALADRSPRTRFVELAGDGHYPHWTQAAAVAGLLYADVGG